MWRMRQGKLPHLSASLGQLPADSGDVTSVGGEPLQAVVQRAAAVLVRLLHLQPQRRHCALHHRLHLAEQNGNTQDHGAFRDTTGNQFQFLSIRTAGQNQRTGSEPADWVRGFRKDS